jgi:leucyl aminopeptidase
MYGVIEVRAGRADSAKTVEKIRRASISELRQDGGTRGAKIAKANGNAVTAVIDASQTDGSGTPAFDVASLHGERLTAFVEGLILGSYEFRLGAEADEPAAVTLVGVSPEDRPYLEAGRRNAAATAWARDLANTPSNIKNPQWLAAQARSLSRFGAKVTVRNARWLEQNGFGGMLAVGAASLSAPQLIEASYAPTEPATRRQHIVLVGKGITFDTGGLNLKPGDSMKAMPTDMSGAAAVLGALRLIAQRQLPVRVTALVPAAENSFGANAYRPSDVVRHYGGRTSEIGNTDAEGRLVLADAMAYAVAELRPSLIVDIATLTGAMKSALGTRIAGFFATDDTVAKDLGAAAVFSGEALWRMPLVDDYSETLGSEIADATNSPGNPGAITAALFLRPFAGDVPWAHLDIAGTARSGKSDGWISRGGTGFGARLLAEFVERQI